MRRWAADVVEPMAMEIELVEVRAVDGDRVFVEYHARGTGRESGVDVDTPIFDVVLLRAGLILRRETYYDRAEALAAVGL